MPRFITCCVAVAIAAAGCQQESTSDTASSEVTPDVLTVDPTESVTPKGDEESGASAKTAAVELAVISFDELQASIAESKGKIVVVDYWSTSCPPCMKEFPGLVALHNELPIDQVRCVSVSLDYEGLADYPIEDCRKSALEFLEQQKSTLENFILSEDSLMVMDEKLKIASIPAVFVFGVDGKLARQFDESDGESFTYEKDITPFVAELVSQSFSTEAASADSK